MMGHTLGPRTFGEWQALRRAGPWPASGTLDEYALATARAVRAAHRAHGLEYRWNRRYRLWEPPQCDNPTVDQNATRLEARRCLAVTIAEDRKHRLQRLMDTEGNA
jgi:hypothetical protein